MITSLADVLREQGRLDEAEAVIGDTATSSRTQLGAYHSTTLHAEYVNARIHLARTGNLDQIQDVLKRAKTMRLTGDRTLKKLIRDASALSIWTKYKWSLLERAQMRLCAPGGPGRARDLAAFEEDFTDKLRIDLSAGERD